MDEQSRRMHHELELIEFYGEPIHIYTRTQALADGVLVAAREDLRTQAGIRYSVAYTAEVHADCIAWTDQTAARKHHALQDETGREWDVLTLLRHAMSRTTGTRVTFELYRVPVQGTGATPRRVRLVAVCGPGEDAEPVITVMQPGQD
jgi:hypothetical protein